MCFWRLVLGVSFGSYRPGREMGCRGGCCTADISRGVWGGRPSGPCSPRALPAFRRGGAVPGAGQCHPSRLWCSSGPEGRTPALNSVFQLPLPRVPLPEHGRGAPGDPGGAEHPHSGPVHREWAAASMARAVTHARPFASWFPVARFGCDQSGVLGRLEGHSPPSSSWQHYPRSLLET